MRWRDIRFEKPTEHNQEGYSGEVLVAYKDNTKQAVHWMDIGKTDATHWAPLSELPDPPAPPEPQYRPFASAAEFEPYRDAWVRRKEGSFCKVASYEDYGATMGTCATVWKYKELFAEWEFADGTPFGVRIDQ